VPEWYGSTVPDGDVRADGITAATPATAFIVDEHVAAPAHALQTRYGDRNFAVAGPAAWNCLSAELRRPDLSMAI